MQGIQKTEDHKELFHRLPEQLRKLVPRPQFTPRSFQNITLKSIESLVNHAKTQTLLSLNQKPKLQQFTCPQTPQSPVNTEPYILVFCQPSQQLPIDSTGSIYPYVPVAYCSWLESLGAKCIPLPYNTNEGSMEFLLERAHGLLIPGGGSNLYKSYEKKEGYGPVMVGFFKLWRMINKIWQRGTYFPIWGTCLGLQIILMAITNDTKVLSNLNSRSHQIEVYSDYAHSRITSRMPTELRIQIENRKLINFQHVYGISVQKFINYQKLYEKLKITGISKDKDGTWFCSMLQGKDNPIFLSQFHPQKQAYSWTLNGDIVHQKYSILLSQYFGEAFLNQCRKCKPCKKFVSDKELNFYLFQQYKQIHTPMKMYKVYAIDYKYRYVDKDARKQLKGQRSISTSSTRCSFGSEKRLLDEKKIVDKPRDKKRTVILPPI